MKEVEHQATSVCSSLAALSAVQKTSIHQVFPDHVGPIGGGVDRIFENQPRSCWYFEDDDDYVANQHPLERTYD